MFRITRENMKASADPRLHFVRKANYTLPVGATQLLYNNVVAQQSSSDNQLAFTYIITNNAILSRAIPISATLALSFTGTAGTDGKLLHVGSTDSLKAYPLNSSIKTIVYKVCDLQWTIADYNTIVSAWNRFSSSSDALLNVSPCMPDNAQNYNDFVGTQRNVMGNITTATGDEYPRGAFPVNVLSDTGTTASISAYIKEYIPIPFFKGGDNVAGVVNGDNLNITCTFASNAVSLVWSHSNIAGSGTITDAGVSYGGGPFSNLWNNASIDVLTLTPSAIVAHNIPKSLYYPLIDLKPIRSTFAINQTAGSINYINLINNTPLNGTPSNTLFFAKPAVASILQPDVYLPFASTRGYDPITFTLDLQPAICRGMPLEKWFSIAKAEELNGNLLDYLGYAQGANGPVGLAGGPLLARWGKEILLPVGEAPGDNTLHTFSATINFQTPPGTQTANWIVYAYHYYDQILEVPEDGNPIIIQNVVSPADAVAVQDKKDIHSTYDNGVHLYAIGGSMGGNGWDNFKNFFTHTIPDVVKNKIIPGVKTVLPIAEHLLGLGLEDVGGALDEAGGAKATKVKLGKTYNKVQDRYFK